MPDFTAVGPTFLMKRLVSFDHLGHDPRALLAIAGRRRALSNHLRKISVKAEFKFGGQGPALQRFAQGPVQTKLMGHQHHAWVWTPPKHGLAFTEPRKNTLAVSLKQSGRRQIGARSQQTWCGCVRTPSPVWAGQGFPLGDPRQLRRISWGNVTHWSITQ